MYDFHIGTFWKLTSISLMSWLSTAYEVLSDEDKKREYDYMGHAAYAQKSAGGGGGQYSDPYHFNFDDLFREFEFDNDFGNFGDFRHFRDFVSI